MFILLYVAGAVSAVMGVALIGFGIPINEFSFGNTLIVAGTVALGSGLILVGLGAAVAQLQRISDALSVQSMRPGTSPEASEATGSRAGAARVAFPPRPKSGKTDLSASALRPSATPSFEVESDMSDRDGPAVAPLLRNPDEAILAADEAVEAPLSPRAPKPELAEDAKVEPRSYAAAAVAERRPDAADPSWRSAPRSGARAGLFDAMWSSQERRSKTPDEAAMKPAAAPASQREGEVRNVAILKSGVVDGMGYTLYVDGSIEAQLPQGTLRFASINELRQHLEKNS